MSEADVIREAIGTDLGEYEIQEPLASLDSLTTRLAEVTDELEAARGDVAQMPGLLAHVTRMQRQLTQAREALERIAELDEAWVVTDNTRGTHLVKTARQALATINREGETE